LIEALNCDVLIANDRILTPVQSATQRICFAREVFVATNNLLENLTEIQIINFKQNF
jgi:hypothetical protein